MRKAFLGCLFRLAAIGLRDTHVPSLLYDPTIGAATAALNGDS